MKSFLVPVLLAVALPFDAAHAAGVPALLARPSAEQQLAALAKEVQAKLAAGAHTEAELAGEFDRLDVLFAENKGGPEGIVADILTMKAQLYLDVIEEPEKAIAVFQKFKADFPTSPLAKDVDTAIKEVEQQAETTKVARSLKPGVVFPAFADKTLKDLDGQPFSLDRFRGKVVLVDFWATWCGPCVAEVPNVVATYKKLHEKGFEIIGISLDQDKSKLDAFVKDKAMPWRQFFDGKGWQNEIAQKFGINSIPAMWLIDKKGMVVSTNARDGLAVKVEKALAE